MSPTADQLSKKVKAEKGRPLGSGDVLISRATVPGYNYYEIVDVTTETRRRLFGEREESIYKLRGLTPHGPVQDVATRKGSANVWWEVILKEDRTDIPSLRER